MRWSPGFIRATAVAAVAAMALTTVGGAVQLPGAALLAVVALGTAAAVVAVVLHGRRPPGPPR